MLLQPVEQLQLQLPQRQPPLQVATVRSLACLPLPRSRLLGRLLAARRELRPAELAKRL